MEKTRYLITGHTRSGTTVIHLAIMGHPHVAALSDEMRISPFFNKGISTFTFGNESKEEKDRGYSALFDALTLLRANHKTSAHGVKISCNSNKHARLLVNVLQQYLRDLKVIIIVRKDLVAQYGSARSARETGIMHSWYEGFNKRKVVKFKINKLCFIAYVSSVFKIYDTLRALHTTHNVLEINYEDLLTNPQIVYDQIFAFLNIPIMEPTWLQSKKVMPPPQEYIKNYATLQSLLKRMEQVAVPAYVVFISKLVYPFCWCVSVIRKIMKKLLL